jgi:hypothetical protein
MLSLTKSRAKRKGLAFNLKLEDIHIPSVCPVLGIPLVRGEKKAMNAPSLDRIKPELGYVRSNVQIISGKANVMKNNATREELLKFAKWIMKTYGPPTVSK